MGPVAAIVVVVDQDFVRGVERVSGLPVRVGHPNLLPREVVLEGTVVSGILQQVSATEAVVSGGEWGLPRLDELVGILLDRSTLPSGHTIFSDLIM